MGLFDNFNPNMGWLGQVLQSRDPNDYAKLADAFGPGTPYAGPQGSYSDQNAPSALSKLGLLFTDPFGKQVPIPPLAQQWERANQRVAAQDQQNNPSMNPADYPGLDAFGGPSPSPTTPPPLAPPRTIPPAPQVGSISPGPTLDQRAYGAPGPQVTPQAPAMPPQAVPTTSPAQAMAQAPQAPPAAQAQNPFAMALSNFGSAPTLGGALIGGIAGLAGISGAVPKLTETGVDPFTGQKTFAWSNPARQTLTPATFEGGNSSASSGPNLASFSNAVQSGVTGPALYDHLPPQMKGTVKAMIEGRMAPPAGAAMRSPQTMALIAAANAIDPQFDATNWGVRANLAKNYLSGGKQFQEMQAIGTVAGHLGNLAKSAEALGNTDYPMVNGVMNWIRSNTGDPRIAKFGTDLQAVSNELSKAYRGGHVTEGDVKEWNSKINAANSPAQLRAVIGEMNDLLKSKREQLETGYKQGMGGVPLPAEFSSESEKTKKTFDSVAKWANGESQAAQSAPITATGPNGQKIVLQNGQWVPLK